MTMNMAEEKREVIAEKAKEFGAISMKVSVDVSEALTGLKAVQREARKASQVLRELETMYESEGKRYYTRWNQAEDGDECFNIHEVCLSDIPTKYLHRELIKREGVEEYVIDAHGGNARIIYDNGKEGGQFTVEGPARIVVNKD